jgi:hypothetical protein
VLWLFVHNENAVERCNECHVCFFHLLFTRAENSMEEVLTRSV